MVQALSHTVGMPSAELSCVAVSEECALLPSVSAFAHTSQPTSELLVALPVHVRVL